VTYFRGLALRVNCARMAASSTKPTECLVLIGAIKFGTGIPVRPAFRDVAAIAIGSSIIHMSTFHAVG